MQLASIETGMLDLQFTYEPEDYYNNYSNAAQKYTTKEQIIGQQLRWQLSKYVMF